MAKIRGSIVFFAAILAVLLGCAKEPESPGLAKIGGTVITEADFEARMVGMPPYMRQQLTSPEGKERFLRGLVEEEAIVQEAQAMGLDDSDEFKAEMRLRSRDALVRQFYEKVIEARSAPTDEDVAGYYQEHQREFLVPEYLEARHILVDTKRQAQDVRSRLDGGASFEELAAEYSLDKQTSGRGGQLHGKVQRDAPIRGLGNLPQFTEACFQLDIGKPSQPIKTEMGYHVVIVDGKFPESTRPLEEVRKEISDLLAPEVRDRVRDEVVADLMSRYDVEFLVQSETEPASPEDLFKLASEEPNARKKIEYYEQFMETYPDNERVYEAMFMIGFTFAEDLGSYDEAQKVFEDFLEKHPESDLSDDARWMLENMRSGEEPEFGS
ncbi:peptidyl-prolyl cis-trans isomerase [Candidatus Eisenbacteria bacterium]|uniref:Peptidyl-prolyl cis-trans isomerase n=1 Tax=Eiseniibacteriota bacterium TaxID=2212470 RepID=A0ABV6YQ03_UNCEI